MRAVDVDPELRAEQEHLAASRAALRRMRERVQALFATGEGVAGDAFGAESLGTALARRVADDAGEPMVLDWRAPVSRAFYRASAAVPQGVAVRRRFGYAGSVLTGFEDEHLDRGEELGTASRILTAEIERPRVGPMRDIVAASSPTRTSWSGPTSTPPSACRARRAQASRTPKCDTYSAA